MRINTLSDNLDESRASNRPSLIEHIQFDELIRSKFGNGRSVAIAIEHRIVPLSHRPGVVSRLIQGLTLNGRWTSRRERRRRSLRRPARSPWRLDALGGAIISADTIGARSTRISRRWSEARGRLTSRHGHYGARRSTKSRSSATAT